MSPSRRIALVVGVLFLITFVTSIGAVIAFQPALDDPAGYVSGGGSDGRIFLGAFLELLLIVANIGTAVVLFPIVRRQSEILALGYVTARIVESTFALVGLISVMSLVSVNDALAGATGAEAAALTAQGNSLAATYDWAFLFGPGLVVAFGNGLILGYLMYRSGLVPRRMAMLGLVGGPMLAASFVMILFGVYDNGPGLAGLMALPEIVWEASLGVYAAWKGFRPSPITKTDDVREAVPKPSMAMA